MPLVKQFSVFVQNKIGTLHQLTKLLAKHNINIRAFSIADEMEWGVVRLIVDDEARVREVLKNEGIMFGENTVILHKLPNRPGALAEAAKTLAKNKISVVAAYATGEGEETAVVLSTSDNRKALRLLKMVQP
ncbi:MAG: ACT domain-containing protein [candidate division KSB1 bacterium]|nr:ACT domain-containing protein [candidate division KSB1 bacterium]